MQSLPRSAVRVSRTLGTRTARRYAHDSHHAAPANESMGFAFYATIGIIPASYILYKISRQSSDDKPYLTRVIDSYDSWREKWVQRNDLHTQMIEQAAHDRNLFLNSRGGKHVELKFPEILNSGSPWNVPAGQGSGNIDQAIAKYEKENYEENERKLQACRDDNVKGEKPYQRPS